MTAFLIFLVFINLLASLAPPFGMDVVTYHLSVPKLYAQDHKISYIPHMPYSNFPFMIHTLYLIALIVKNGVFAQLIAYSISVLLALSAYAFSSRSFNKKVAIISAFIIYTMPMVIENATQAYVDISFAFFSFMAFYSFLIWSKKFEKKWIVLCALMLAFSASTKLLGLFNVFLLSLFVFYVLLKKTLSKKIQGKYAVQSMVLFGIVVLLVGSVWYVKSYLYTGNPVFPYFYNVFGGKNWDLQTDAFYKAYITPMYQYRGFVNFLLLPWNITMHSQKLSVFLGFGPLFLAFIPLYVFTRKDKVINQMLLFSFFYTILWYFLANPNLRYLCIYPLLAISSAHVAGNLLKRRLFYYPLFTLFISFIIFSSAIWYGTNFKQLAFAFGLESEQEFYDKLKYTSLYEPCNFVNKIPNSKILLLGGTGSYFCNNYVQGDSMSYAFMGYSEYKDADDLQHALKDMNITHIIFSHSPPSISSDEYLRVLNMVEDLLVNHTVKVFEKNELAVYELK